MNHAAVSPVSLRVVNAVESLFREFSSCGFACYHKWMKRVHQVRQVFARLINSDPGEVAFVGNTSEGLSAVATGLEWKPGDVVLIPEPDFPANVYPWMNLERHGVEVRYIKRVTGRFGLKEIENVLTSRTRLISVSSVDFATGFLCNLEALGDYCRRKGLLFCVDAIQSLGLIPMDIKKFRIHFLATGGQKWLLSTMGCGALFISRDVNDLIHPELVGWKSVMDEENFFKQDFDLKRDALRFEPGTMNIPGIYALGTAIDLLLEVGISRIYEHVSAINDELFKGLQERGFKVTTPMGEGERSGILSFIPSSDPASLFKYLTAKKIMVSLRDNMIRLSPHFYNNREDVSRFFQALDNSYN